MEDVVLIVADDRAVVEADLAAGRLLCPRCGVGALGGWGCARLREVHMREGKRRLRPRRGRCRESVCAATHVLLPDLCLARRQDAVEVIGEALLSAEGARLSPAGETGRSAACGYHAPGRTASLTVISQCGGEGGVPTRRARVTRTGWSVSLSRVAWRGMRPPRCARFQPDWGKPNVRLIERGLVMRRGRHGRAVGGGV